MGVTVLDDVILDDCVFLAGGAGGSQTRKNDRSQNQAGYATVNAVRDVTLRQYQLGVKPMSVDEWAEVEGVYEITDAGCFAFLIRDPKDRTFTFANGGLQGYMNGVEFGVPGFGNGTPTYGFRKFYQAKSSSRLRARPFTRLDGTPVLKRGGVTVVYGAAAGNAAIGAGPSYVTFVADASRAVTGVTVGATTQVNIGTAITGLIVNGRLWLQDLGGADAAILNNMSHLITGISGSTYTLATNTAGKTVTFASATGKKYPQPDEALTAQGSFFVPVQFAEDNIDWSLVLAGSFENRLVDAPSVMLIEIREA